MSLDLGQLAGRLMLDIGPLKRDVGEAKGELKGVVSSAEEAGNDAGEGFSKNWGDSAKKGAIAAGAAFGTAVVVGLHGAMERESAGAVMTAQLGLSPEQQAKLGRRAGRLYAGAYGDSITEVNEALVAAKSTLKGLDGGELRGAARDALNFKAAFDTDTARSIQIVGQLIDQHLVKTPREGFDLLFRSLQKVPSAVREDMLDAADEYGQFFSTLGYDGREAFQVLVNESAKGMYGIDKAGDAIKEFTIRATDGSDNTQTAFQRIGVNAGQMADDILAGGDRAHDATQKIIQGLLDIEDPSRRANTALLLFGTPMEDLNTRDIPKFLRGLQDTGHQLDDVKGAANRANTALGSTADADFTKLKRRIENDLIGVMEKVLPVIEDDVVPAIEGIGDALEKIPSWAIKGSLGGLFGLYAAGKLGSLFSDIRGLRGGISAAGGGGLVGKVASKLDPVPVFVVNEMPGGAGVPGGGGGGGIPPVVAGAPKALPKWAPFIPVGLGSAPGQESLLSSLIHGRTGMFGQPAPHNSEALALPAGLKETVAELNRLNDIDIAGTLRGLIGPATDVLHVFAGMPTKLLTKFELDGVPESKREVKALIDQYDLTPSQMKTLFDAAGIPNSIREVQALIAQQSNVPKDVTTAYHLSGYQEAMQQIATLRNNIDALASRGVDNGLVYGHGGQRTTTSGGRGRVVLQVGQKEFDGYLDERAQRQVNAQDDWRAAVGG